MNLIKPNKIKSAETIAFIAPSGFIEKEFVLNAKSYFEKKGYKVELGKHIFSQDRYLAGTDQERLADLHWAFSNPEIKMIMCVRGGYGALRLIDKIDYDLIKNNPKIFCGYSDITVLSLAFLKKCGLISFSSPMPKGDFQPENIDLFTEQNFWKAVTSNELTIEANNLKTYNSGNAEGILWGGNLSSIVSLCGLDFIPDEKFIFFAEDLNEPVYKIDKSFSQLLNIKKFRDNVSAIVLGDFLDIEYPQQLEILFNEIGSELNIPVYGGYPISHAKMKTTIPIGASARLFNGEITLL